MRLWVGRGWWVGVFGRRCFFETSGAFAEKKKSASPPPPPPPPSPPVSHLVHHSVRPLAHFLQVGKVQRLEARQQRARVKRSARTATLDAPPRPSQRRVQRVPRRTGRGFGPSVYHRWRQGGRGGGREVGGGGRDGLNQPVKRVAHRALVFVSALLPSPRESGRRSQARPCVSWGGEGAAGGPRSRSWGGGERDTHTKNAREWLRRSALTGRKLARVVFTHTP